MTAISLGPLLPSHRSQLEKIVRAAGVFSDAEVVVALELFDDTFGAPAGAPSDATDYQFLGAYDGDSLVGYACYGATPATDRTFDLYWIAVHPDAQRAGAGSTLMEEVERRLRDARARLLVIETSSREDYAPTRAFYRKRGYDEAARLRDFYAPGDDRVILTRHLAASPRA